MGKKKNVGLSTQMKCFWRCLEQRKQSDNRARLKCRKLGLHLSKMQDLSSPTTSPLVKLLINVAPNEAVK